MLLIIRKNKKEQLDILERLPLPLLVILLPYMENTKTKLSMLYVNMHVCMYVLCREGYSTSILSTELLLQEHGLENL